MFVFSTVYFKKKCTISVSSLHNFGKRQIHKLCRLKGGGSGSKIADFETTWFMDGPLLLKVLL